MYSPRYAKWQIAPAELGSAVRFMNRHSFAVVVSASEAGGVSATHLPIVASAAGEAGARGEGGEGSVVRLEFHLARPNEHAGALLAGAETRVIFSGPHAYISPNWYEQRRTVPTWNYVAIHVVGKPRQMRAEELGRHLDELVRVNEAALAAARLAGQSEPHTPWDLASVGGADGPLVAGMSRGVIGFVLESEQIHGKRKLSQNRSMADRLGTIAALRASGTPEDAAVADWMEHVLTEGETEADD